MHIVGTFFHTHKVQQQDARSGHFVVGATTHNIDLDVHVPSLYLGDQEGVNLDFEGHVQVLPGAVAVEHGRGGRFMVLEIDRGEGRHGSDYAHLFLQGVSQLSLLQVSFFDQHVQDVFVLRQIRLLVVSEAKAGGQFPAFDLFQLVEPLVSDLREFLTPGHDALELRVHRVDLQLVQTVFLAV